MRWLRQRAEGLVRGTYSSANIYYVAHISFSIIKDLQTRLLSVNSITHTYLLSTPRANVVFNTGKSSRFLNGEITEHIIPFMFTVTLVIN